VEQKMAEIKKKPRSPQEMRAAPEEMIDACDHKGPAGDCPCLETLEQQRQERKKSWRCLPVASLRLMIILAAHPGARWRQGIIAD
jgi:hypothetical protein